MRMKQFNCYPLSCFLLLLVLCARLFAQAPPLTKGNAKIAGRITIEGKPALGVRVSLKRRDDLDLASVTATTNDDGRYELSNLPSGAYRVSVNAPAFVIEGDILSSYEYATKEVNVAERDEIENLNFSLVRGGVITGKVTDESGMPVIAEGVGAFRLDQQGKRDNSAAVDMLRWQTDDRGVYRIFGLEAGRYVIGAGASAEDALRAVGTRGSYKRTYHPDVANEASAKIIEIKPGGEVKNVDIKLSRAKRYAVTGRVIDSETDKPLAGVTVGCDVAKTAVPSFKPGETTTNKNGEFRIEGLTPNTYVAYVFNLGQSETYSDRVNFEIADGDVDGIEIKMIRGAIISGTAEVEGTRDPAVLARLSQISLRAEATSQDIAMLMMAIMQGGSIGNINPDGKWRIEGVRQGKTRIVATPPPQLKAFSFARVERNGVEIKELDVTPGEQITGVRLVFTYGTSVLSGHVEIKGGALPPNTQMTVSVVREGSSPDEWWYAKQAIVDAQGKFSIEGVSQGNYKAHLIVFTYDNDSQPKYPKVEQSVFIPDNGGREITLVLDLTKKNEN